VSTVQIQRDQRREAAKATGAILGPFVALIDNLIAAQTRLINSYICIASSIVDRSRAATPTPTTRQRTDDQPAPAVPTDSIEARAYEIFIRRGRTPGNPVDDWRRAEAELRGEVIG